LKILAKLHFGILYTLAKFNTFLRSSKPISQFNTFYTAWGSCVWFMLKIISYQTVWGLCARLSGFQPEFRGTSGFHERLTGVPPKQTEFAG